MLTDWLAQYRDLAVADRVYRMAVARSTRKVRRHRKLITVAVVTNIPAPTGVGSRSGGYEDVELPEPYPSAQAARGVIAGILSAIRAGQPDQALALMRSVEATATPTDRAILAHRIAASYRAESRDADAYALRVSGNALAPAYRAGDVLIVSPNAEIRRGDRIIVKTRNGEILAKELVRQSGQKLELKTIGSGQPSRALAKGDVLWMARVQWVRQ